MNNKFKQLTIYITGAIIVVGGVVFAGPLNPSINTETQSYVTLSDIYNKLHDADYSLSSHSISTTTSPASSTYDLAEIYGSIITVPGRPTDIQAITTLTREQVTVTFTPPTSTGGSSITGYIVYSEHGNIFATGTGNSITLNNLNDPPYTFNVKANNIVGSGLASGPSNIVSPLTITIPSAPQNAMSAPGPSNASVSFSLPADDGGSTITGYTVTGVGPGGTFTQTGASTPIVIHFSSSDCARGDYVISVTATNSKGTSPAASAGTVTI